MSHQPTRRSVSPVRLMTVDDLLTIDAECAVCRGERVGWSGHQQSPPCAGAAREEVIRRARERDEAMLMSFTAYDTLMRIAEPSAITKWFGESRRPFSAVGISRYLKEHAWRDRSGS